MLARLRYRHACPHCGGRLEKAINYVHGAPMMFYTCVDCGWYDNRAITPSDGTEAAYPGAATTGTLIQYTTDRTITSSIDETDS